MSKNYMRGRAFLPGMVTGAMTPIYWITAYSVTSSIGANPVESFLFALFATIAADIVTSVGVDYHLLKEPVAPRTDKKTGLEERLEPTT